MAAALGRGDGKAKATSVPVLALVWRRLSFHGARGPLHTSPSRGQSGRHALGKNRKTAGCRGRGPGPISGWGWGLGGGGGAEKDHRSPLRPREPVPPEGAHLLASVVMRDSAKGPTLGVSRIQIRALGERPQHSRPGRSPDSTHIAPAPLCCTFTSAEAQRGQELAQGHTAWHTVEPGPKSSGSCTGPSALSLRLAMRGAVPPGEEEGGTVRGPHGRPSPQHMQP